MEQNYALPQGYIDLISRRYNIKVLANHYILVDEKFQRYNIMLDLVLNEKMLAKFRELYAGKTSAMHVAWEERPATNSIRFYAEVGNNIILLLDTLVDE